jgi:hopanoid biosynthesis associated protein HpnK
VRRLIVNADDFGLTAGVNRAIMEAHTDGVVSSATLMANGAAFENAAGLVQSAPKLSVGCHVVLVDGAPVAEPASVATLLADTRNHAANAAPRFYSKVSGFAARAILRRFDRDQLVNEIVAQVRKVQRAGIQVTHLDTHKHTHIFPTILSSLVRAARTCGIPAIRNPIVPVGALRARQMATRPGLWKRYGQVRVLHSFAPLFRQKMNRAGLATPDGVIGVVETGSFDRSLLRRMLSNLPSGTYELVTHPGYNDADLGSIATRLRASREVERRLLVSDELRGFLRAEGIEVIGYREFAGRA